MFPGPRQREHAPAPGSSPKLQVLNTAPMTAQTGLTLKEAWRDRDRAVDFVARAGQTLTAIEVKSGRARDGQPGLAAFAEAYRPKRKLLVGGDGIPLEEFLFRPVQYWVRR